MKYLYSLLNLTVKHITKNTKGFWLILGLGTILSVFFLLLKELYWSMFDFSSQEGVSDFFQSTFQSLSGIFEVSFFLAISFILPLLYDFYQKKGITNILLSKEIQFPNFFSLKSFFPFLFTNIASVLYSLMFIVPIFIVLAGVAVVGIVFFGEIFNKTMQEIFMISTLCIVGGITLWIAVQLIFTLPVFFTEDVRYFGAVRASKQIVRGRWWKTFGAILGAGAIIFIPAFLFEMLHESLVSTYAYPVYIISTLIGESFYIIAAMLMFSFLCTLYESYKKSVPMIEEKTVTKNPIIVKKKVVKKIKNSKS